MKVAKIIKSLALIGLVGIMSACNGTKACEPYKADPFQFVSTYRDMRIEGIGYTCEQFTTKKKIDGENIRYAYEIENVRTLVVPIDFTDYPAEGLPKGADGSREDLRIAMFGTKEETEWYSLSEFYRSSSFGKCNVTGTIADWYHINMSSKVFASQYSSDSYVVGTNALVEEIQNYYLENPSALGTVEDGLDYNNDGVVDLKDFDANGDNYIDALIMIYSRPQETTKTMWWAYCASRTSAGTSKLHPWMYRYFWCSFYFFYENASKSEMSTAAPDSHTMIHEFGHVLSLPDYYVTDYNSNDYDGLGGLDMMDMNVGDHNAMSKSFYGWTYPTVVEGKCTVTLRSTTDTGDFVIIPAKKLGYKNTLLDQYIMVEFLTPTGVATYDGTHQYAGSYPLYYNKAGVRICLVDARLGVQNYNQSSQTWSFGGFTTVTRRSSDTSSVSLACDNTATNSCYPKFKLIEVIPGSGKAISKYGIGSQQSGDNTVLYQEGQVFGSKNLWNKFMMHDKSGGYTVPFGYKISIDKIDGNNSCTISIS